EAHHGGRDVAPGELAIHFAAEVKKRKAAERADLLMAWADLQANEADAVHLSQSRKSFQWDGPEAVFRVIRVSLPGNADLVAPNFGELVPPEALQLGIGAQVRSLGRHGLGHCL